MAKFKSSSREGSFQSNQLIVPDEVRKIQNEGNRRLQGMNTAQAHLQKNQELFLRAQQQAQIFQEDDRRRAKSITQSNLDRKKNAAAENWSRALAQEEAKNKSKVDTFGALAAFSKTAFDITSSIVQQNQENQLKAINQIAFKHQYSHQDLVNAKSVDSSITQAAWQETNIVQDYLKQGKSQEFINTMYDHLVKGGGYSNYIDNANVLSQTARNNSLVFDRIANDPSISVQQKRQLLTRTEAEMRGELAVNGKIPGVQILEKAYNPIIREALRRSNSIINKETRAKLEEDNSNRRIGVINNAAYSNGGFNPKAVLDLVSVDPRPGAITEMAQYFSTKKGISVEDLTALKETEFNRNGQMVSIDTGGYIEALAIINSAIASETKKEKEQQGLELQARQLEATMAMNALAQELATDDGILSNPDYRRILKIGDEVFGGPGRDTSNDNFYKRQTADQNLIPVMVESLEEMRSNRSLSVAELDRINPPKQVYDTFLNDARRFDKIRSSPEYKELDKYLAGRITGSIKDLNLLKFNPAGPQSDQFNWYVGEQVKKYRQLYFDLAFGQDDIDLKAKIGDRAATESLAELSKPGALTYAGITAYNDAMAETPEDLRASKEATRKLRQWRNLKAGKNDPSNWSSILGDTFLKKASDEFQKTGKSQTLETIARDTKSTIYEVQQKLAEAGIIEPVDLNPTYAELQSNWSKEQRYSFTSNQSSNEQKLRTLQQQVNQLQSRNDYPVRSTFQTTVDPTTLGSSKEWAALGALISFAEGTGEGTPGYQTMFGGGSFTDMSKHPDTVVHGERLSSAAAGRFQFMPATWAGAKKALNLKDFGPLSQEMAGAYLTRMRGVDPNAVIKTKAEFVEVMHKLSPEWAALPKRGGGSQYPEQRARKVDDLWNRYQQYLKQYGVQ